MLTKMYEVLRLSGSIDVAIDGHGKDPAWKSAPVLDDFSYPELPDPAPSTLFRSLWNDDYLYFLFNVSDTDIVLSEIGDSKDRVLGSDRAEIFIASGPELQPYYGFEMDPRGEVLDYRAHFHHRIDWDWVCEGLQVRATRNNHGYVVEGSIPMSTLKQLECLHEDDEGAYLIAGLFRGEFSHGRDGQIIRNWITWVDPQVEPCDFHVPSAFGKLKLIQES